MRGAAAKSVFSAAVGARCAGAGACPTRVTAPFRVALHDVSRYIAAMGNLVPADDPILRHFKAAIEGTYGDRIDRVVLFGSRARTDAKPDSDYDIAVFLKNPGELWDELGRLARITTDILDETGVVISAKPFPANAYHERSPLMHEIRADELDL